MGDFFDTIGVRHAAGVRGLHRERANRADQAGHGIGACFHCAPNIPHYAGNKAKFVIKPGHCFTIEPMINMGTWKDTHWPDGWTAVTRDGQPSAQFEHTLLVHETGVEVLTARLPTSPPLWWEAEAEAPAS